MKRDLKYFVHKNHIPRCAGRLIRAARCFSEQNGVLFVFAVLERAASQSSGAELIYSQKKPVLPV